MGKLESLIAGRVIAFDTAPLIYYIEENPTYLPVVEELFESIDVGTVQGLTSVLTLLEVLVRPLRDREENIADKYRMILTSSANPLTSDRGSGLRNCGRFAIEVKLAPHPRRHPNSNCIITSSRRSYHERRPMETNHGTSK